MATRDSKEVTNLRIIGAEKGNNEEPGVCDASQNPQRIEPAGSVSAQGDGGQCDDTTEPGQSRGHRDQHTGSPDL